MLQPLLPSWASQLRLCIRQRHQQRPAAVQIALGTLSRVLRGVRRQEQLAARVPALTAAPVPVSPISIFPALRIRPR